MSFFDEFKDEGGGSQYLSASEKAALIDNNVAFQIVSVKSDDDNKFQNKPSPRFVATVLVPNPLTAENEARLWPFGKSATGSSRDRMLEAMGEYLDSKDAEDVFVQVEMIGNFQAIKKAE